MLTKVVNKGQVIFIDRGGQGRIKLVGAPGAPIMVGVPNLCVKLTLPLYLLTNINLLKL